MIASEQLNQVAEFVDKNGLSEQTLTQLRNQYSGHHFTWCMEDDIHSGKPILERDAYAIYLVNSQDHCSVLTNDLDSASGYVFAEFIDDE